MSSECLTNSQAIDKLNYSGSQIFLSNEYATKNHLLEMGAETTLLEDYTNEYECPPDDAIQPSLIMTIGNYVYDATISGNTDISFNQKTDVFVGVASAGKAVQVRFELPYDSLNITTIEMIFTRDTRTGVITISNLIYDQGTIPLSQLQDNSGTGFLNAANIRFYIAFAPSSSSGETYEIRCEGSIKNS